jgi:hypothetical protein
VFAVSEARMTNVYAVPGASPSNRKVVARVALWNMSPRSGVRCQIPYSTTPRSSVAGVHVIVAPV